ncbi:MAG: hypothetical protein PUP90_13815 [Nostoc sp. S4]|nr:hypothetical protein [Nostoc sp. S4]
MHNICALPFLLKQKLLCCMVKDVLVSHLYFSIFLNLSQECDRFECTEYPDSPLRIKSIQSVAAIAFPSKKPIASPACD